MYKFMDLEYILNVWHRCEEFIKSEASEYCTNIDIESPLKTNPMVFQTKWDILPLTQGWSMRSWFQSSMNMWVMFSFDKTEILPASDLSQFFP